MIRVMRPITVKEVAETVKKLIGAVEIEYKEERPGDFEGKIVSAERAKRELDWEPKVILRRECGGILSGIKEWEESLITKIVPYDPYYTYHPNT